MTALTILNAAFGDLGVYSQGETLDASTAQDGLRRLNGLVSSWRTQSLTVLAIERQVFPLVANQQTYTIGLGGDFNVPRPQQIQGAALWLNGLASPQTVVSITRSGFTATVTVVAHGLAVGSETLIQGAVEIDYNGLQTVQSVPTVDTFTYTLEATPTTPATGTITSASVVGQPVEIPRPLITDDGYQAIQLKNLPNSQFTNVYYNPTQPFGTIVLWPLPNTATNQLVLYLQSQFAGFADLSTDYTFPDVAGYAEALQYQLCLRLASPYGTVPTDTIRELARTSLALVKRQNYKLSDLPNDAIVISGLRQGGYNINTDSGG